jgi:hypothetical protein
MKIRNNKWSIFLTSILIFQLVLSSICLIDFQTKFSHHQNEIVLKQLDSNSQVIEETESLFVMIEETKEEIELNYFSLNPTEITNFSTKSWIALNENLDSRNYSFIPYSPPEKVSQSIF